MVQIFMSAGKYTGGFPSRRTLITLMAALLWLSSTHAATPGASWTPAPEYIRLFAPAGPRASAYQAFISSSTLDAALSELAGLPDLLHPTGAWAPQPVVALDAFGREGAYNRGALARLYGARRARVARGPRAEDGRVVETWTMISPYPDPRLEHLEAGTLLLVLRLP